MKEEYKTPPYTEAQMKLGEHLQRVIDKIKDGKSEEEGVRAVREYFFGTKDKEGLIKIKFPNE